MTMINDFTKEELVLKNMPLAYNFAKKIMANNIIEQYEMEEIEQVGKMGLIKAARTYNGSVAFSTYASRCIINEINYFFRRNNRHYNKSSLDEVISIDLDDNEITLGEVVKDSKSEFVERVVNDRVIEKTLNVILNTFSTRDIYIFFRGVLKKSQSETARKLNIGQPVVSRRYAKLLKKSKTIYKLNDPYTKKYKVDSTSGKYILTFSKQGYESAKTVIDDCRNQGEADAVNVRYDHNITTIKFYDLQTFLELVPKIIYQIDKSSINLEALI